MFVGLGGELRSVSHAERRVLEAAKLGYAKIIVPPASRIAAKGRREGIELVHCRTIRDAIEAVLGRRHAQPSSFRSVARAATGKELGKNHAVLGWPDQPE